MKNCAESLSLVAFEQGPVGDGDRRGRGRDGVGIDDTFATPVSTPRTAPAPSTDDATTEKDSSPSAALSASTGTLMVVSTRLPGS